VISQTMWSPHASVDRRQHVEEAKLQMPVFFEDRNGRLGLELGVSIDDRCHAALRDADEPAPLGHKTTTHIRIVVSMTRGWFIVTR